MKYHHPSKNQLRLQNLIFLVLFLTIIGLLGWLSSQYHFESDWTANSRNTLSEQSTKLLATLEKPILVEAFLREGNPQQAAISEVFQRYQRYYPTLEITFINPDTDPDRVREQGITMEGEMVIHYGERRENLKQLSEEAITNTLMRLARSDERWIVFLNGHGERDPLGEANFHYSEWGKQLQQKGFSLHKINLSTTPEIPTNTSVLVIADPRTQLLPGEIAMIQLYLQKGGNLLWLREPDNQGLDALIEQLGLSTQEGILVDPTGQLLGISDPRFAIVAEYPNHPITSQLESLTLFPQAGGIKMLEQSNWHSEALLTTLARSWLERDEIVSQVDFGEGDQPGPIMLGVALEKTVEDHKQRVVMIHDADFLSNSYLGNGGNLDLALNIANWLSFDDRFIAIPAKSSHDTGLELDGAAQFIIGFGFLVIIPGGLLLAGIGIWLRRRKR